MPMAKRQVRATKQAERRGVAFKPPSDLIADLDVIAAQENRSRAKQVEVALREFVQNYWQKAAARVSPSVRSRSGAPSPPPRTN